MMPSKRLIAIGSTMIGLLLPMSAGAYTPPNEALIEEKAYEGFALPPSKRYVQERVDQQQEASQTRRDEEQAGFGADDEEVIDDTEMHGAAGEEEEVSGDEDTLESVLDLLEQSLEMINEQNNSLEAKSRNRLLERLEAQSNANIDFRGAAPTETVMHGGAPLAHTGPASMAAGLCLAAAALWTLKRANRKAALETQEEIVD